MLTLTKKTHNGIIVSPRFPAKCVKIDAGIFEKLVDIQKSLPQDLNIILTRGYEDPNSLLGISRKILRYVGKVSFSIIYPSRLNEISEIFVPNGHDKNGKHIDISIAIQNKNTNWLPFGVFTSPRVIAKVEKEYEDVISLLGNKILAKGGRLHNNRLERLQMHVDFAD